MDGTTAVLEGSSDVETGKRTRFVWETCTYLEYMYLHAGAGSQNSVGRVCRSRTNCTKSRNRMNLLTAHHAIPNSCIRSPAFIHFLTPPSSLPKISVSAPKQGTGWRISPDNESIACDQGGRLQSHVPAAPTNGHGARIACVDGQRRRGGSGRRPGQFARCEGKI